MTPMEALLGLIILTPVLGGCVWSFLHPFFVKDCTCLTCNPDWRP